MVYTVKEMVDMILSAMGSEEVNSITDTQESADIALLLKALYYDIAVDLNLPEHKTVFQLNASGDAALPCLMKVPSNVMELEYIKYNHQDAEDAHPDYKKLYYVDLDTFITQQQGFREDVEGIGSQTVTHNGQTFVTLFETDRDPSKFTQIGDDTFLFDSYDSTKEGTLQQSKTMCEGLIYPVWVMEDDFTPDLDPTQFPYFLSRAKVRAFSEIKQQEHQEAAGEAKHQRIIALNRKRRTPDFEEVYKGPNFGRR